MVKQVDSKDVANISKGIADIPDYMKSDGGMGNENLTSDDLTIPRLSLLQALSQELKKTNSKYIEDAEAGQIANSISKEAVDEIQLINVFYRKDFPIFTKRKFGGGFNAVFSTKAEAWEWVNEQPSTDQEKYEVVETANHFVLIVEDGRIVSQAIMAMASTKLKFSREWNSKLAQQGDTIPRFATIWTVSGNLEANKKGDEYYNYTIKQNPEFASEETYAEARKAYETVSIMSAEQTARSDKQAA